MAFQTYTEAWVNYNASLQFFLFVPLDLLQSKQFLVFFTVPQFF